MLLYKYIVSKHNEGEYYYSTDTISVDETQQPYCHFKYDKVVRLDFIEENGIKIVFLFDNKLAFECFGTGMNFRGQQDKHFAEVESMKPNLTIENATIKIEGSDTRNIDNLIEKVNPLWQKTSNN